MSPRKSNAKFIDIMGFTFPTYHEGKKPYIDFYCPDPETGQARRKKYYITAKTKRERKAIADDLMLRLTAKLRQGWNPWANNSTDRGNQRFGDILDNFLAHIKTTLRQRTVENYTSKADILRQYISELRLPCFYAMNFDKTFVSDYLDWLKTSRSISPRTYNNYRGWLSALAEYMIQRSYISENPTKQIHKLTPQGKNRKALSDTMLRQLFAHLNKTDRPFLLAVMMEYYTFIRPNELRHIRIRDISFADMSVFIPAEHSKNKRNGRVALNEQIITHMIELKIHQHNSDEYLFGRDFLPSSRQADSDIFNKRFAKTRKTLGWPDEIKFYSLKDSGIRDLSQSEGIVTARDQARHTDISTTNKYLEGRDLKAPEAPKHFQGYLRASDHDNSRKKVTE